MCDYIDFHCDTLLVFAKENGSLYENEMSVDLKRLQKAGCLAQFFAIWLPDPETKAAMDLFPGLEGGQWDEAYMARLLSGVKTELELHRDLIAFAGNYEDLEKNREAGKMSAFLTLEDGRAAGGNLEAIKQFYEAGIRLITLTWNFDNCFGRANYRDGVYGSRGSGLTAFGKEAVSYMNDLGMMVDVSHLSDEGFYDVAKISKKPFVASHSNARSLSGCSRNLSDEMIRILAEKGGVTGLNFAPGFLGDFYCPDSKIADMAAHARYIVDTGGEEVLCLGSDLDGIEGNLEIASVDQMGRLWDALKQKGFTERQLELVMRKNAQRVIRDTLG